MAEEEKRQSDNKGQRISDKKLHALYYAAFHIWPNSIIFLFGMKANSIINGAWQFFAW